MKFLLPVIFVVTIIIMVMAFQQNHAQQKELEGCCKECEERLLIADRDMDQMRRDLDGVATDHIKLQAQIELLAGKLTQVIARIPVKYVAPGQPTKTKPQP